MKNPLRDANELFGVRTDLSDFNSLIDMGYSLEEVLKKRGIECGDKIKVRFHNDRTKKCNYIQVVGITYLFLDSSKGFIPVRKIKEVYLLKKSRL